MQNCLLPGDRPSAREGGPGARQLARSAHSSTQPARFLQLGQDHSPCRPGKNFPTDKSSLLLSKSSPTPARAVARLSPGGRGTPGRSHRVTQLDTRWHSEEAEGSLTPLLRGAEIETLRGGYRRVVWLLPV